VFSEMIEIQLFCILVEFERMKLIDHTVKRRNPFFGWSTWTWNGTGPHLKLETPIHNLLK